jgi:DNA invertase Pin-like site-specific DNA recombinase
MIAVGTQVDRGGILAGVQAVQPVCALADPVLVIWALDRIVRDDESGAEAALRIFRQFRQRGCIVVSVKESWLNGSPEVQDILIAFAGWMAERESARRSERIKAGLARRRAKGKAVGHQAGAKDKGKRKRSGYVKSWEEGGARREAAGHR